MKGGAVIFTSIRGQSQEDVEDNFHWLPSQSLIFSDQGFPFLERSDFNDYCYVNPSCSQMYLNEYSFMKAVRVHGRSTLENKAKEMDLEIRNSKRQCGYLFDDEIRCKCAPFRVKKYFHKITGPIIDRIDLEVPVNRVPYKDLLGQYEFEKSEFIKERVTKSRDVQNERFKNSKTRYNSRMTSDEIKKFL